MKELKFVVTWSFVTVFSGILSFLIFDSSTTRNSQPFPKERENMKITNKELPDIHEMIIFLYSGGRYFRDFLTTINNEKFSKWKLDDQPQPSEKSLKKFRRKLQPFLNKLDIVTDHLGRYTTDPDLLNFFKQYPEYDNLFWFYVFFTEWNGQYFNGTHKQEIEEKQLMIDFLKKTQYETVDKAWTAYCNQSKRLKDSPQVLKNSPHSSAWGDLFLQAWKSVTYS